MEDGLKVLKVEYLSNHWSDLFQISSLISGDHTKIKNAWNEDNSNERRPQTLKVKYLSNHWSDLPQIVNVSLNYPKLKTEIKQKMSSNGRGPKNIKSVIYQ